MTTLWLLTNFILIAFVFRVKKKSKEILYMHVSVCAHTTHTHTQVESDSQTNIDFCVIWLTKHSLTEFKGDENTKDSI